MDRLSPGLFRIGELLTASTYRPLRTKPQVGRPWGFIHFLCPTASALCAETCRASVALRGAVVQAVDEGTYHGIVGADHDARHAVE